MPKKNCNHTHEILCRQAMLNIQNNFDYEILSLCTLPLGTSILYKNIYDPLVIYADLVPSPVTHTFPQVCEKFMYIKGTYQDNDKCIHIDNIHISDKRYHNKGYGSVLMLEFLQQAAQQGVERIEGIIVSMDWNRHDMLTHFYAKHGFEVRLDFIKREGVLQLHI